MAVITAENFSSAPVESSLDANRRALAALAETNFTLDVQNKVMRITRSLLPYVNTPDINVIGFGEAGGGDSVWLTTAVAASLGAMIDSSVHVLVIEAAKGRRSSGRIPAALSSRYSLVEYISARDASQLQLALLLEERIANLSHTSQRMLLHFEDAATAMSLKNVSEKLAGLVLMARASQTRKAALESLVLRCEQLGFPLLGAVLLDRVYPIPEQLYRLL